MNRTRETVTPSEALKLIINTLNNPSIAHERIEPLSVYNATSEVLKGRGPKPLSLTARGVIVEGLADILATVHAWKPVAFDVARGVKGERAYARKGPKKAETLNNIPVIHDIDLMGLG